MQDTVDMTKSRSSLRIKGALLPFWGLTHFRSNTYLGVSILFNILNRMPHAKGLILAGKVVSCWG